MFLFEEQEDSYSCGAYAFRNACAMLGIKKTINECKQICNTISYKESCRLYLKPSKFLRNPFQSINNFLNAPGTSEDDLIKAVKKVKLKYEFVEIDEPSEAYEFLVSHAPFEHPILIAVNYSKEENDSGHWITCVGIYKEQFVMLDSAPLLGNVLQLQNWKKLKKRFVWYDKYETYFEFIGIAVRK